MIGHSLQSVCRKAGALALKKTTELIAADSARQMNCPGHPARETRFQRDITPWNKGTKRIVGVKNAYRATQIRADQAPHNTQPIGSTKLDKNGILLQKVSEAKGNTSKRWRGVKELVWIEANGPLPPKHIVVFKPGMKTNFLAEITIDRVECTSLVENMRRNTCHRYPKQVANLIAMKGALIRQINNRERNVSAKND